MPEMSVWGRPRELPKWSEACLVQSKVIQSSHILSESCQSTAGRVSDGRGVLSHRGTQKDGVNVYEFAEATREHLIYQPVANDVRQGRVNKRVC